MRISWKRIPAAETNYELLWLGVSLSGLVAGAAWLALGLPWPICAFHALTGLPCVTCGATRATIQFFHGHFLAAWIFNPLILAGLCAIALFDVYAFAVVVMRAPRLRLADWTRLEKKTARVMIAALLALNWAYLLAHPPA